MGVLFAVVGLYQEATRDVFWNPKVKVDNAYAPFYRVNSVFYDPSVYGRFLVVAILAALVIALYDRNRNHAFASAAAICVIWVGLLFSFSQSSFAALIVGTAVGTLRVSASSVARATVSGVALGERSLPGSTMLGFSTMHSRIAR